MRSRDAALLIAVVMVGGRAEAQAALPAAYVDFVHQLTDLDRLTHAGRGPSLWIVKPL